MTSSHPSHLTILEVAGGPDAIEALAAAWHRRVLADPVVAHAFSHGIHPDHTTRLAAYLIEALGGPDTYTASIASPSDVVRMHSGNGPHHEMDERALRCWAEAVDEVGLGGDARVRNALVDYFATMIERMGDYEDDVDDVPADLPMIRWGWSGPLA
jgi:hemoglobin